MAQTVPTGTGGIVPFLDGARMVGSSRWLRLSAVVGTWLALAPVTPLVIAQTAAPPVSAVSQVHVSATVAPRVVFPVTLAPTAVNPVAVAWRDGSGGTATITFSANAPYRLLARRADAQRARPRIWVGDERGRLVELTGAASVAMVRGGASTRPISVPFRATRESDPDGEPLPLFLELEIDPTQ